MVIRALFLALALVADAGAASVTVSTGWTATVADFACDTVIGAMRSNYSGAVSGGCDSQIVGINTTLRFFNSTGGSAGVSYVTAVSGWTAPATNSTLQTQVNTLSTTVSSLGTRVTSLESSVSTLQGTSSNDPYQLSPSEGAQVAVAMLGLLAVAWSFRAIVRALREVDSDGHGA